MKLLVWVRDEGVTDKDFKDGDIFRVYADSYVPGGMETKRWLCVAMEDFASDWGELTASEYAPGAGVDSVVRRMRKYRLNYVPKLTPDELAAARDPEQDVPVITDRFNFSDIVRK